MKKQRYDFFPNWTKDIFKYSTINISFVTMPYYDPIKWGGVF